MSGVNWNELDVERCTILDRYSDTDGGFSLKIKHPEGGRPKIFLKSRGGNWFWLAPKPKFSGEVRKGYIIKGEIIYDENK